MTTGISKGKKDRMPNGNLDLNGAWRLSIVDETPRAPQTPAELAACTPAAVIPAEVPGNFEHDLERAGLLGDVFYGLNSRETRRCEWCSLYYERTFVSPARRSDGKFELVFDGVDCCADVSLNGEPVGSCDNALIPHRFPVTLRPAGEENSLWVHIWSPLRVAGDEPVPADCHGGIESLFLRKPAHCYGWDIMPRLVSGGLWRGVRIEEIGPDRIESVYIHTSQLAADRSHARLEFDLHFHCGSGSPEEYSVRIAGHCGESRFERTEALPFFHCRLAVELDHPRLWWPRGYGAPDLYEGSCQLLRGEAVVVERRFEIGVRQIRIDRSATVENGRFRFVVNGVPIFVRGFNHVGLNALHGGDPGRLDDFFRLAEPLQGNMIRCWGGSVYDEDEFYARCDRAGMMVWQDFAMACTYHPRTPEFQARIRREAESVVSRLRNHACLALWCGDNEVDIFILRRGKVFGSRPEENDLTRRVLPEVLRRLDPARAYVKSSPEITPESLAFPDPEQAVPEQHLWGAGSYFKSPFYLGSRASFVSEVGYLGCPGRSSLRRFLSPEKLWPWRNNDEWNLHSTETGPVAGTAVRLEWMAKQMRECFGEVPETLPEYVRLSQIVQAEALKFFVEWFRQRKGRTGGILWWNLLDGWPQFSDAVCDYYFHPKLAYHYLRRVHAPLALMVREPDENGKLELVAVNDALTPASGSFSLTDADTGGTVLSGSFRVGNDGPVSCGAFTPPAGEKFYLIRYRTDGGETGCNHYHAGKPPFSSGCYLKHLEAIAGLDGSFSASETGA